MQPIDEEDLQKMHRKISFVIKKGSLRDNITEADPTAIFQLQKKLGQGSYGTRNQPVVPPRRCASRAISTSPTGSVYTAVDKRDGSLVAVKVLQVEEGAPLRVSENHTCEHDVCHSSSTFVAGAESGDPYSSEVPQRLHCGVQRHIPQEQ